jgi:hypothetical protein
LSFSNRAPRARFSFAGVVPGRQEIFVFFSESDFWAVAALGLSRYLLSHLPGPRSSKSKYSVSRIVIHSERGLKKIWELLEFQIFGKNLCETEVKTAEIKIKTSNKFLMVLSGF